MCHILKIQGGDEALGRSRGGLTTKVHLTCDGKGRPLSILLTPGQRHDSTQLVPLLDAIRVPRAGRGRPRTRPERVIGDKGYSYPSCRRILRRRGIVAVIAERRDQRERRGRKAGRPLAFDRDAYRRRNVVERCMDRLKQWRSVATRYEKRATNYRAMVVITALMLWLDSSDTPWSDSGSPSVNFQGFGMDGTSRRADPLFASNGLQVRGGRRSGRGRPSRYSGGMSPTSPGARYPRRSTSAPTPMCPRHYPIRRRVRPPPCRPIQRPRRPRWPHSRASPPQIAGDGTRTVARRPIAARQLARQRRGQPQGCSYRTALGQRRPVPCEGRSTHYPGRRFRRRSRRWARFTRRCTSG